LGGLGSKGANFFHCASASNGRDRTIGPPPAPLTLLIPHLKNPNHPHLNGLYPVVQQLLVLYQTRGFAESEGEQDGPRAFDKVVRMKPVVVAAGARPYGNSMQGNKQFVVTSYRLCRGCADTLSVERSDGSGSYEIARIYRNFIFDADRSQVFYPKIGHILDGSIVIFNLNTQQSQEILPVSAQAFLDQRLDPDQWYILIAD
jgi:hypothetical protein